MEEKALAGQAYKNITNRIMGEEVGLLNLETEEEGKLSKILKLIFGK